MAVGGGAFAAALGVAVHVVSLPVDNAIRTGSMSMIRMGKYKNMYKRKLRTIEINGKNTEANIRRKGGRGANETSPASKQRRLPSTEMYRVFGGNKHSQSQV